MPSEMTRRSHNVIKNSFNQISSLFTTFPLLLPSTMRKTDNVRQQKSDPSSHTRRHTPTSTIVSRQFSLSLLFEVRLAPSFLCRKEGTMDKRAGERARAMKGKDRHLILGSFCSSDYVNRF